MKRCLLCLIVIMSFSLIVNAQNQKKLADYIKVNSNGKLTYVPDDKGNIIPDFSRVGYQSGNKQIPEIKVVKKLKPLNNEDCTALIQEAIDEVSNLKEDKNGFRGAILLTKGVYKVSSKLFIRKSGIVLRGEGDTEGGTKIVATGKGKRDLLTIAGTGWRKETPATRANILDQYVPVGSFSFKVNDAKKFKVGDDIVVNYPASDLWIAEIKMNQIEVEKDSLGHSTPRTTKQWEAKDYEFSFERKIVRINNNEIFIKNPIVMPMDTKYGQFQIYKYTYDGRVKEVGVENILFESEYASDRDEDHGWNAVVFEKAENCWVNSITARYFAYAAVNIKSTAKLITVQNSKCYDAKSIPTGGRRYSFNVDGQLNLVKNCETRFGRHDFVTGAKTLGPNAFVNCKAEKALSDIGPHHRWSVGTLYDNVITDRDINAEDRGNWGTGHGWAGTTQVFWNCAAKRIAVQSPWVSGKNYAIGIVGQKVDGRLAARNEGEWVSYGQKVSPKSLYENQLAESNNLKNK